MIQTPTLAIAKVAALPEAAHEQIAGAPLHHIDTIPALRSALAVGVAELDAGLGRPLDVEKIIRSARSAFRSRLCKA
jgi:hypothetical protein